MHKGFFLDVLRRKPALFAAMVAFNARGGAVGDGDALGLLRAAVPGAGDALLRSPRVRRWLEDTSASAGSSGTDAPSADLSGRGVPSAGLSRTDVPPGPAPFWDFAEESRRMALLDGAEAARLALVFGTALHAPDFSRLVRRDDVLALRTALGADLYAYGLQRGRYQLGGVRRHFAPLREVERTGPGLAGRIREDGARALALCAAAWPDALRARLAWPGELLAPSGAGNAADADIAQPPGAADTPMDGHGQAVWRGVWFGLRKLLLKEVAPQWAPCFD